MIGLIKKIIYLFVILQIFILNNIVESKPEASKGNGKAVGAAVLAGLGGAAIGHVLTRSNSPAEQHHYHHFPNGDPNAGVPSPVQQARPSTIIERGETLPNGCYKQTIKEPDFYDITRFIETEQLICPPNVPAPPAYLHPPATVPQQPQPVLPPYQPVQPAIPYQPAAPSHPIVPAPPQIAEPAPPPQQPPNISDFSQFPPLVPGHHLPQPASVEPIPMAPVATYVPQPAIVHPQQPLAPDHPSNTATSQVIVLSKKTGSYADDKKKNDANDLLKTNTILMLLMMAFVYLL